LKIYLALFRRHPVGNNGKGYHNLQHRIWIVPFYFEVMKIIQLTQGYSTMVDDEDYEMLMQWSWCIQANKKYAMRLHWTGKKYEWWGMHRRIMGVSDRNILIDHIDHNGLNNQKYNLRITDKSGNMRNMYPHKNTSSKYIGVGYHHVNKNWNAYIYVNRIMIHVGVFKTEEEAAIARDMAAIKYFGEFAHLNILTHESGICQNIQEKFRTRMTKKLEHIR